MLTLRIERFGKKRTQALGMRKNEHHQSLTTNKCIGVFRVQIN